MLQLTSSMINDGRNNDTRALIEAFGADAGPGDWLRALSVASLALRQPQSKSGQRLAQYLHELLFPALSQPEEIR